MVDAGAGVWWLQATTGQLFLRSLCAHTGLLRAVAELAPAQPKKKKKGALHKLGKMLRGGPKPTPLAPLAPPGAGRQPRANPAALTAPLEHSMRQQEAAALQEQLLREQVEAQQAQQAEEAQLRRQEAERLPILPMRQRQHEAQLAQPFAGEQPLDGRGAAPPEPAAEPDFNLRHTQQQQQQQWGKEAGWEAGRRHLHFTAAQEPPHVEGAEELPHLLSAEEQLRLAEAEQQLRFMFAGEGEGGRQWYGATGWDAVPNPLYDAQPAAGHGPLQELVSNLPPPGQAQHQQAARPGSAALSDCPPDGARYRYPQSAEAGYAAGLAAAAAEGIPVLAAGGAVAANALVNKPVSWQQKRLHVVHSNVLFSDGEDA